MTTVLLKVPEAAERLRIHEQTVRKLIKEKELSATRIGRFLFVPEPAIDEFIASHTS